MGFWNKLGKIALQAAPYVAAPFTGGASLYFTPATQKLGQKWAEHDAKKAAEKGLAPSKFDKYLGMASSAASLASGTGALGKFGSAAYSGAKAAGTAANAASTASKGAKVAQTAKELSGWQNRVKQAGQIASMASGGSPYAGQANYTGSAPTGGRGQLGGWQGQVAGMIAGEIADRSQNRDEGPRSEELPSRVESPRVTGIGAPRGSSSIGNALNAGRREAIVNQPFRGGYQTVIEDRDQLVTHDMPPMYPNYNRDEGRMIVSPPISESAPQTPIANAVRDELTPRRARRRNPEPAAEEEY